MRDPIGVGGHFPPDVAHTPPVDLFGIERQSRDGLTHPGTDGIEHPKVRADMVFFETPNGGAVFSTGSITWAGSLGHNRYDNNVARITGNVLRRFVQDEPF